jgi:hypothetical protein
LQNYQWCGAGFQQLPTGLGMGGAGSMAGQFGLYVNSSLEKGMTRPVATFGNPPLAQQDFEVSLAAAPLHIAC